MKTVKATLDIDGMECFNSNAFLRLTCPKCGGQIYRDFGEAGFFSPKIGKDGRIYVRCDNCADSDNDICGYVLVIKIVKVEATIEYDESNLVPC